MAVVALICCNSHHDSTVARHWEPHVVRVGIDGILIPGFHKEVFFISVAPFLSEYQQRRFLLIHRSEPPLLWMVSR